MMDKLLQEALENIADASSTATLKEVEVSWLGKKGRLTNLLKELGSLAPDERKAKGQALNELKRQIIEAIANRELAVVQAELDAQAMGERLDPTLPGFTPKAGRLHPLTLVIDSVEDVFERMGFHILDYPEAETEFFNFDGLNIPADHPARDTQDTFYLTDGNLLRTHTSPGQVRAMRDLKPPFRAIFPGRVFRCEATDASHEHTFHQVEGLMIDRNVSVAHMLHSMMTLLTGVFGRQVQVRLRPGFFPFVEPGFELDLRCMVCDGAGCPVCKQSGWVELLPCGLVHPNVIRHGGLDPSEWEGWAFGLGLSRLVMMRYQIDDIRWLLSGDLRFVRQF
ncbi:MAG TPA: phenylalanine--tRNA ligase subunit alpha [Myxococcota bacterium]|nr:phenylalanine--tRNA ligase subunit alpha [Myxococcota bacterium]